MTREKAKEIIEDLKYSLDISLIGTSEINEIDNAMAIAIKSLEAWEKIDDEIASLRDTYSIGNTYTEKLICENLQAVRKTIHEYLKEVSE